MLQENLGGWGKDILFKFMFHERIFQHMPEKWYRSCYLPHTKESFPTSGNLVKKEEDYFGEVVEGGELRFKEGTNGGHLMGFQFQYKICHVRDLDYRDPNKGYG